MASAAKMILLPGGVYFEAFSNKLTKTRSISSASMRTSGRSRGTCTSTTCCFNIP